MVVEMATRDQDPAVERKAEIGSPPGRPGRKIEVSGSPHGVEDADRDRQGTHGTGYHLGGGPANGDFNRGVQDRLRPNVAPGHEHRHRHRGSDRNPDRRRQADVFGLLAQVDQPLRLGIQQLASGKVHHHELTHQAPRQWLALSIDDPHLDTPDPTIDWPGEIHERRGHGAMIHRAAPIAFTIAGKVERSHREDHVPSGGVDPDRQRARRLGWRTQDRSPNWRRLEGDRQKSEHADPLHQPRSDSRRRNGASGASSGRQAGENRVLGSR